MIEANGESTMTVLGTISLRGHHERLGVFWRRAEKECHGSVRFQSDGSATG
jgi:hypothetical protein